MAYSIADLEAELPSREMNDLVTAILASSLRSLGLFSHGRTTIASLALEKPPAPFYERWLSSGIEYLRQQGVLAGAAFAVEVRELADLWQEWDAQRSAFATNPNAQAQCALLEACLQALPEILSGRRRATDVMFPNSSMQLVEGIYRGNPQANHFNEVLGRTLSGHIEGLLKADPERKIRIVEIGAGTGGTTAALLPMLQRHPVEEYCYTDLSRAFLMHAEKNFLPQFPALTTAIFDVARPLDSQSVAANHYDFAIAANVLHATSDIRETLRNAKALLRNQGVLLLNEIAAWSMFNHLTFGLLEGWWLYEDAAVRLPGSPGLAPETWREIMAEEGFESIAFPAEEAHGLGQQIVAAVSNGWTRQRIVRHAPGPVAVVEKAPERAAARPVRSNEGTEQAVADHTRRIITAKLAEALRMDAATIRDDASFADFGVDSIVGVNLVRNISEALQIELETTSLFEYSTVEQLTAYVLKNWKDQIAAQVVPAQRTGEMPVTARVEAPAAAAVRRAPRSLGATRFAARDAAPRSDSGELAAGPVAIIGMSGRFAESESLEAFWEHLAEGRDLVKPITRWSAADCVVPGGAERAYCSHGSFIDSIDRFDPEFFGISAVEATYMDPQQRLFLEESWRALEDAGYAGKGVHEKQCGVYVGCGSSSYDKLSAGGAPPQAFWGNSQAVTPARIAYCLDLQGPAIAIDTACSSSLVAIHLACLGLWARETEMALAGGVFLQPTPGFYQVANRAGMLSPEGKCRSFDARADGFVPGEGVGVVVLKRLDDALADGDHIHGVIAASGINQDGRSNGLIAPNGRAQERLERSVYERFKINPETIQVLEAHGTGTLLGDSIEYGAVTRAFREHTDRKQFCALGTVKTNIGHTSTAAGVAGVLRILLALRNRQIPPSLHFEEGNPAIDFASGPFYVNRELRPWETDGAVRRAAVSSFGFSGTNAHLILEEAPAIEQEIVDSPGFLVVLSARTGEQLQQQVRNLLAHLERSPGVPLNDLSFTLLTGRMHLAHRLACVARDQGELMELLAQWSGSGAAGQTFTGEIQEGKVREQVSLKKFGNYCIQECRTTSDTATYFENLAAIGELHVQGYSLDFASLFDEGARRIPLPAYPFARERYWVEASAAPAVRPVLSFASPAAARTSVVPRAADASSGSWLQDELARMAAEILHIDAGEVAPERILADIGFDSVGLTRFASAINEKFRLEITPILFFDYPSLREIAKHLSTRHEADLRSFHRDPVATTPRQPQPMTSAATRVPAEARKGNEPIAIVGIAGVMPQAADLDAFWKQLESSHDMVTVIPEDRWNWEDYYGDPLRERNKSGSKWGGFMKEVDKFDPLFFGISPREAQMMDPQQRIFLETVWKAIEDSAQKPSELSGTRTGVFVGVGSNDYIDVLRSHPIALDGYTASGNSHSVLANRVSFLLDLRGPSAPIDTACSSSLVALHRAVESIHAGSSDMAIAGGVQVILSPGAYISFGKAGMLSPDGKCKTFDKSANGYVRGEGCGVVFLKPLSRAEADGDHIYAVLRSTSENHGGRVTTMTAPNSAAQAALLIEAYEKGEIDPATVGYVECHGTGTTLGDPIEVQALTKAFGELYERRNLPPAKTPHCGLGTVKSNIGHLETAAGIAGVLKVVLALEHKKIPATIHFEELNPYINLKGTPFYVVDQLTPWQPPTDDAGRPLPRRAGVSSFGFGGANAHAVLEEYVAPPRAASPSGPQLIVLSAKNRDRLDAYVGAMRAYVETSDAALADFAYTLQTGRDEMPERLAFVAGSMDGLKRTLDAIAGGVLPVGCHRNHVARADSTAVDAETIEQKDLARLASLWVSGMSIDWRLLHEPGAPRRLSVPTYPFARERYWIPGAEGGFRPAVEQTQVATVPEEREAVLQSLVPVWHPVPAIGSTEVTEPSRVLLLGSDPTELDWVRTSYPSAELLELATGATIEAIEEKLRAASFDQLLWIAPEAGDDASIVAQQEQGVLAVFRIVKALQNLGYATRPLQWTLVTRRTQCVRNGEPVEPAHAGVGGLIGSVAKEMPRWDLRMLDVDSLASITPGDCLSLPWDKQEVALAHRAGEWFRQRLDAVKEQPRGEDLYRRNRVYVVIGGAHGIGQLWSRAMIEQYQAHVVWIGRRAFDDSIEQSIRAMSGLGSAPIYIQADATDPAALEQARRTILETYSAIHGVVHSALVLHDRTVARMDEQGFRAGLAAKVAVSAHLDQVFGRDELDFVLFFSSVASFLKPAGQSNYAAGCTFKDSFARMLQQQRPYPVKVMNWGYWGETGAAAGDAARARMARVGLGSIEPHEGLAALHALMSSDLAQVAFVKTLKPVAATVVAAAAAKDQRPVTGVAAHVREVITGAMCEELRIEAALINADAPLGDYGVDSIVGVNLVSRISDSLRIPLEAASLFEYGTVNQLADYIVANWAGEIAPTETVAAPPEARLHVAGRSTTAPEPESRSVVFEEMSYDGGLDPLVVGDLDDAEVLDQLFWQDASLDDGYEKVTF